ncbi:hypothetical protein ABZ943_42175, partial [Streptomyces rubiginosohelvolus]|uniref:hypothetical protein n=1 Tax=Streptomyces rubiginosohelvolus TaxID=67362 RepID=UPI0033FD246D
MVDSPFRVIGVRFVHVRMRNVLLPVTGKGDASARRLDAMTATGADQEAAGSTTRGYWWWER